MAMVDAWFEVGGHPALNLHSSNEPGELSQWLAMMTAPKCHLFIITGLPTHSVGGSIVLLSGVCRLSSYVTLHEGAYAM